MKTIAAILLSCIIVAAIILTILLVQDPKPSRDMIGVTVATDLVAIGIVVFLVMAWIFGDFEPRKLFQ